ncbi:Tumor necrosis factor alpha-induced protein 8-like protein 2 [Myotis brandtii]|uniref:Tumor necrosis factor alpha-induced protein 8-like protein 2 n=1 Tax=Myotis brandtii TaxID=109478 RepID=S7PRZ2_MYOBR|nr:PREDICTED: tumor necrosis factor alpha-induced protein 8-like protein 2 [Myotis brandtii]EPQ11267.1 Tumor necrosis factor alpha-induced protein 8-like protein 2 [Myotis brandtii]
MESSSSKSLALHVEKLPSKMAGRSVAHLFTYETSSEVLEVLDELYRVSRDTKSRPQAQRVIKDLIKVAVKVAVLHRSGCFSPSELALAASFRQKLRQGAMTALSFGEVDFTFEAAVLASLLTECRDILLALVQHHLTPKSHGRIRHVFDHFSDPGLLTALYGPDFTQHLGKICDGLRKLLDEGKL